MHEMAPSFVAMDGAALAGYALVMPVECRSFIPILEPMFERLGFRRVVETTATSDRRARILMRLDFDEALASAR